jgi:ElaB/YqjD/DUF883 family membrane-anchored ribosome-binding protein
VTTSSALARVPTQALEKTNDSAAQARVDLARARERVSKQLAALEQSVPALTNWRDVVRRHPVLTLGGALLTGFAIARLFSRR